MSKERFEKIEKNLDPLGYGMGGHLISVNDIYWLVKYAREQAERVEELEKINKKLIESTTVVANENHRYKLALEFYANKKNYDIKPLSEDEREIPVFKDYGKKARQALEGKE